MSHLPLKNQALEVTLQRSLSYDEAGGAFIPGDSMRYGTASAAADVIATAFAMMAFYRYLPMA